MRHYILFYRVRARRKHYVYYLKRLFTREKYVIVQESDINIYNKYSLFINMYENLLYCHIWEIRL